MPFKKNQVHPINIKSPVVEFIQKRASTDCYYATRAGIYPEFNDNARASKSNAFY